MSMEDVEEMVSQEHMEQQQRASCKEAADFSPGRGIFQRIPSQRTSELKSQLLLWLWNKHWKSTKS